jgi:hypothetical protein
VAGKQEFLGYICGMQARVWGTFVACKRKLWGTFVASKLAIKWSEQVCLGAAYRKLFNAMLAVAKVYGVHLWHASCLLSGLSKSA